MTTTPSTLTPAEVEALREDIAEDWRHNATAISWPRDASQLEARVLAYGKALETAWTTIAGLEARNERQAGTIDRLRSAAVDTSAERDALQARCAELDKQIHFLVARAEGLAAERNDLRARCAELESSLERVYLAVGQKCEDADTAVMLIGAESEAFGACRAENNALAAQLRELKEKYGID